MKHWRSLARHLWPWGVLSALCLALLLLFVAYPISGAGSTVGGKLSPPDAL